MPFLTQFGPTFWPPKEPNEEFFKQNFSLQLIRWKLYYYYQFCDYKVKFLKIISFWLFLTQFGQKSDPNILKTWHFSLYLPKLSTQVFVQLLLLTLICIPCAKYEKNLLIMPIFLLFFHSIGPNLAQILPQDHTHFVFLLLVSN